MEQKLQTQFEKLNELRGRFQFGKNWLNFLDTLDENRIREAERSLTEMLGLETLKGLTFLDVGCGSGLFSLAAVRLGATAVRSFDFDPQSVECAKILKERYSTNAIHWTIESGSILDLAYLRNLGQWDIVYSWGVLHHTGQMWKAFDNIVSLINNQGSLYISIYNDQGLKSRLWRGVKAIYNKGIWGQSCITAIFFSYWLIRGAIGDLLRLRDPRARYQKYKSKRGMSMFHDWKDWLGGYPFEVATVDKIFDFYSSKGLDLEAIKTTQGLGCNEFVFTRES